MKKLLSIILLITSILSLSCNHNKLNSSLTSSIGKVGEITVNPLGVTPLSAVYTTETVNAAPITVTVKGLYGEPDIIHTYPAGYGTEFEIHGMFPESQNTIEVNDGGRIITKNINIGSLSTSDNTTIQKQYNVEINELSEEKYTNNPELYFIINATFPFHIAISKNGYTRYLQSGLRGSKLVIENKKIVLYPMYDYKNTDLLGNILINYPTQVHHDVIKVNNNYLYLSYSTWGSEDRLVEIDSSGKKLRELSFGKLIQNTLDLNTYKEDEAIFKQIVFGEDVNNIYVDSSGQKQAVDWFHANSIVYDSSTDTLYVSSRTRGVFAIDYSEWKLIWWMADDALSSGIVNDTHLNKLASLGPYRVKGAGKDDGPKNQHALFLFANGNLGMFDNQGNQAINPNGSRYVEYTITGTHGNYTAQKVYEYRDSSLYSQIMSDVDFIGENYQNLLLTYSWQTARIVEAEKNTKSVLFRLDLPFETYRVDKLPLYYDEGRVYSEDCNLKNPN
ncbi:aryl-sulfate sulfotransferase [Brachyspira murdochii]|uniref:Arylsulfotransferase n=1 Tax=Brachyspira murdochii (strain ATCC 51284 / DSM 12563 / 56-150) TaxID=526224 RepID=D5UB34_BRAM5|nr:aryl-sulfate sulfotransferase [Brachyspira murdochii]ADG71907.1 Arylsulfotransferase [Brachyspira murdochii DSM 12563]